MKRGLSTIIATILIILITITAVAIMASIIIPFTRNSLEDSTACLALQDSLQFDDPSNFNCYTSSNQGEYRLSVKARADEKIDEELIGLVLVLSSDTKSLPLKITSTELPSDVSIFRYIEGLSKIPTSGELRTYIYTTADSFTKAEVIPISKKKTCDPSDSIELKPC